MKINFVCTECSKEAGPTLLGEALAYALGEPNPDPKTAVDWAARVLGHTFSRYIGGDPDIAGLFSALRDPKDPLLADIDIVNRQALWTVLGMLKKEKERVVKSETPSGSAPNP